MILDPKDIEGLGHYINEVSRDPLELGRLAADANGKLNGHYNDDLTHANSPRIVVHQNTARVMHMVIPHAADIDEALGKTYSYPPQYTPNSGSYIDPAKEPQRAVIFRVGDYTLNSCM